MAGHALLDRVVVGAGVDDAPHRVGDLLGGLRRGAAAHLVDQRELEALDLLLGRAFPSEGNGTPRRCSSHAPLTIAKRLRRTIGSVMRRASVPGPRTNS